MGRVSVGGGAVSTYYAFADFLNTKFYPNAGLFGVVEPGLKVVGTTLGTIDFSLATAEWAIGQSFKYSGTFVGTTAGPAGLLIAELTTIAGILDGYMRNDQGKVDEGAAQLIFGNGLAIVGGGIGSFVGPEGTLAVGAAGLAVGSYYGPDILKLIHGEYTISSYFGPGIQKWIDGEPAINLNDSKASLADFSDRWSSVSFNSNWNAAATALSGVNSPYGNLAQSSGLFYGTDGFQLNTGGKIGDGAGIGDWKNVLSGSLTYRGPEPLPDFSSRWPYGSSQLSIGTPLVSGINFIDPTNPLTANGVMESYSSINGMLLNTQSGQIAFGSSIGTTTTSANWGAFSINNNAGSLNFSGLNQTTSSSWYTPYLPPSNDYSYNPGWGLNDFDYLNSANPIVLDLTGAGINITELGSSAQYVDMTGDGYKNRTAWAGAGNGVLVFDVNGNGLVDSANEFQFTAWDPTATTDMQALRDVFDTNHDGMLDASDTNFAAFKVLVTNADGTTTLKTLAELGIASINLTTDNYQNVLADGSTIAGRTTFTRTDGSTGTAADVSLAYDAKGYATQRTVALNADGSTTIDVKALNANGSLANETASTTSADGLSRVVKFDQDGNGIFDQTQTIVNAVDGSGNRSNTIANFDVTGALHDRTVTTTSANGLTVTIARDTDGNGLDDQTEQRVTNANGSRTITLTDRNPDGSARSATVSTTSQDGLTKSVQTDLDGIGGIDRTRSDITVVAGDGSRVETIIDKNGIQTVATSVLATSADGRAKTTSSDLDGDGDLDRITQSSIVVAADGSSVTTQTDRNGTGTVLIDRMVTELSADGLSRTKRRDADGNGVDDLVTRDVSVRDADGSVTQTITSRNGNETVLLGRTVEQRSADGRARTVQVDSNGDGVNDRVETIVVAADGSSTDTVSNFNADGSLRSRSISTVSADGLSTIVQQDLTSSGTGFDHTRIDAIVVNADGSRTETIIDKSANGTVLGTVETVTTADGLSTTTHSVTTGGDNVTRADVTVLNANGGRTETITDRNAGGSKRAETIVATSADRLTVSTSVDANGDGHVDRISGQSVNAAGVSVADVADYRANGALLDRSVTTSSANGLSVTTQSDIDGDGFTDRTHSDVIALNADGSRTETVTDRSRNGTLLSSVVSSVSANGLSVATQSDLNGDGLVDRSHSDITVLDSDGGRTETIDDLARNGALLNRTVSTVSATGLSVTTKRDINGDGLFDLIRTDVTQLNPDGGRTETVSDLAPNSALLGRIVTTTSASGTSVSTARDINGDGTTDQTETVVVDAAGSTVDTVSDLNANGTLRDRLVTTKSASGLIITTQFDTNGDGTIDQTHRDETTVNANGSRTRTVTDRNGSTALIDRTIVNTSANGLSQTTQWDNTGSGVFDLTEMRAVTLNADGSRVEMVSEVNADNSLRSRLTTTTSADGKAVTVERVQGGTTSTLVTQTNANGSVTATATDYNADNSLRDKVTTTTSADGLTITTTRDSNGDGLAEATRSDVTLLSTDGGRVETVTNSLSGTVVDRVVSTTSATGLSTTVEYDNNGDGIFDKLRTDVTVLNADGSRTETVNYTSASGALISRFATTTSSDGLSITKQWDTTGSGSFDQTATDVTVINADGSRTETVRSLNAGGGLISEVIISTSADGLTEAKQISVPGSRLLNQSQTIVRQRNADGSTKETLTNFDSSNAIRDRAVTVTSADGMTVTTTRDNNGDGVTDQVDVIKRNVDGSSVETVTDYSGANITGKTVITTATDGLTRVTQQYLSGGTTLKLTRTDVTVVNLDGSRTQTVTDRNPNGSLRQLGVMTTSADGRTRTLVKDTDGDGFNDHTETTSFAADGSSTTIARDFKAPNVKTSETITQVSADGRSKTASIDSDANGIIDRTETTRTNVDGTTATTATDLNVDGTVKDHRTITASADGRVTVTLTDTKNAGTYDLIETDTTNIDGTRVVLAMDATGNSGRQTYDAGGNLVSEVFTAPNGSSLTRTYVDGVESQVILRNTQGQVQPSTYESVQSNFKTSLGHAVEGGLSLSSLSGVFSSLASALVKTDKNTGGSIGQAFGSAIGRAIAGNDPFAQLAAGTVVGAIGASFGQALSNGTLGLDVVSIPFDKVFTNFGLNLAGAAAGTVSSFLAAELGTALGLQGFGAQLFNAGVGAFAGSVLNQAIQQGLGVIQVINWGGAFANAGAGIAGALGSYLGSQILHAQTQAGAIGGQIAGAVGAAIGTALSVGLNVALSIVLPGIGSLIGTILGTFLGDLFGSKPHPYATDWIAPTSGGYVSSVYITQDQGNIDVSNAMASAVINQVNAYLTAVNGASIAQNVGQLIIGYSATDNVATYNWSFQTHTPSFSDIGEPVVVDEWVYQNGHDAQGIVDAATVHMLRDTEVVGGNILVKRAHQRSTYSNVMTLAGDLQVALDYERYLNNREIINALMEANPNSAFTAGWAATFARVQDLGLNHYGASDFIGGLGGYLDSVKKAGLVFDPANVSVAHHVDGSITLEIRIASNAAVPGELSAFASKTNVIDDATGRTVQFVFTDGLVAGGVNADYLRVAGNDTYLFNRGDGVATYFDHYEYQQQVVVATSDELGNISHHYEYPYLHGNGGSDTLLFGAGIRASDVTVRLSGSDLIVGLRDATNANVTFAQIADKVTLKNWTDTLDRIETFRFADGTVWSASAMIFGGVGNDTFTGTAGADLFVGGLGNDTYTVNNASDVVMENAGEGIDTMQTSLASYSLMANVENLIGTAVTGQSLTGNALDNVIKGGSGNDVLEGGAGNDTLVGSVGTDTAVFSGARANYVVTYNSGTQTYTVADQRGGAPDGTDALTEVEYFRFADGTMAAFSLSFATVIEMFGTTSLVSTDGNYFLMSVASGTGPALKRDGAAVVAGSSGTWSPVAVEQLSGGGYDVAWRNSSTGYVSIWSTDSNGNFTSNLTADLPGTDIAIKMLEFTFHQDLNGDGSVGVPFIESFGSTNTVLSGGNYYLVSNSAGAGPVLKYQGSPVIAADWGSWTVIAAEQVSGGGYDVVWKSSANAHYSVWSTDSNGNFLNTLAAAPEVLGNDASLEALESVLHQDLNGDKTIGVPTTIESLGSTSLVLSANNYYLISLNTGTGPTLKYQGSPVLAADWGAWTVIAAEQVAGGGYDVVWKHSSGQFSVWSTDGNGAYLTTLAAASQVAGTDPSLQALEPTFHQDLNGDGIIGVPPIESYGSTSLVLSGGNYYLNSISSGNGPVLKYQGSPVIAANYGAYKVIAAEQLSDGGYNVAWKNSSTGLFSIWNTDSNGNFVKTVAAAPELGGTEMSLKALEPMFHQDLNGDGAIGLPSVELNGSTITVLDSGYYFMLSASTGTGQSLKYQGSPVIAANYGAYKVIAAEQVSGGGYDVVWRNSSTGYYSVWSTDSAGNFVTTLAAAPEVLGSDPSLKALEPVLHQDLNGDGVIGASPVVLDLDGNGIDLVPLSSSSAAFDMDGQGRERTAWISGADGLLAIDLGANGSAAPDGIIDQTNEIVFTAWAPGTTSDMDALAQVFDTNHDGELSAADARWDDFRIWQDLDADGFSRFDEVHRLSDFGISSIDLHPVGGPSVLSDGSVIQGLSSYTRTNGTTGIAGDVTFAIDPSSRLSGAFSQLVQAMASYSGDRGFVASPEPLSSQFDHAAQGALAATWRPAAAG